MITIGYAAMFHVAYRIAYYAHTGQADLAANQYKAHLTYMSPEEVARFRSTMLSFAADMEITPPTPRVFDDE